MRLLNRLPTLAIILFAFAARVYTLGDVAFWYDEGLVGWTARRTFEETARWTAADVHPPLYFWAVTVWRMLSGESEFALRLVSVAFGVLSVAAAYKIGERIQGPAVGNLAALFLAVNRFHIWWSQELRMYILGSMFMLFSVWLTLRIAHGKPRAADWIAYVLVSLGGLLSIYLVAFALAFESLYITLLLVVPWLMPRLSRITHHVSRVAPEATEVATTSSAAEIAATKLTWRKYLQWVAAQAAVILLFLPWFLLFASSYRTWSDSTPYDVALFVQFTATMLAAGVASNIDEWLPVVAAIWAILLFGAGLGVRGRREDAGDGGRGTRGGWLVLFLLILPPLTVYLGTSPRSFFYTPRVEARYLFPFIWSFAVVLGWCVWRIARANRWLGLAATVALLGLFGAPLAQYYAGRIPSDVYQSLAATLRAHRRANDAIVLHDDRTWPIFEFYLDLPDRRWKGVPNGARVREGDAERLLGNLWTQSDGVWLVWNEDALRIDENHLLEQWLSARAARIWEMPFGAKRLLFYARTKERAELGLTLEAEALPAHRMQVVAGDGVALTGYDLALQRYRSGDEIQFGTYWLTAREAEAEVSLTSESYERRFALRVSLPSGTSRMLTRFPVTTALQPGAYRLMVTLGSTLWLVTPVEVVPVSGARVVSGVPSFTPRTVQFQNGIRLIGYDMPATALKAGDNVQLTLYWQTDEPIAQRYKAFVHLLGTQWNPRTSNPLWGQRDQEPANGALPTTAWGVGSVIEDTYLFRVAPDAPPGKYQIEIGMYHPTTGERLPITAGGAADHVILLEVELR